MKSLIAACLILAAGVAQAKEAAPMAEDPVLEARVLEVSKELRCLVCQNQTIADSHAELAVDLRNQVREQLRKGVSEKEVIDYMVQRYGDFVLYRPPVKATTFMLWVGPFLLLGVGAGVMLYTLVRRRKQVVDEAITEAEHQRVIALLKNTGSGKEAS